MKKTDRHYEKWTEEQIAVCIRMYPNDKQKRLYIARKIAAEFPNVVADIGEKKTLQLRYWLELQGVQVQPLAPIHQDSWAEVVRLIWRYWKNFTPLELIRVLVWSAMGFKP